MKKKKLFSFRFFLISLLLFSGFFRPINIIKASEINKENKNTDNQDSNKNNNSLREIDKDSYLIGPGDLITLFVYDSEDLSNEYQVLNDGTVNIPIIGMVDLNFLSIEEATSKVREKLSKEFIRPEVYLSVKKTRPIKVSIIGEVSRPGLYVFGKDDEIEESQTIFDAIKSAGGITGKTNIKNIEIKRRLSGKKPKFKKTNLNFYNLIFKGDQSQNIYLFDGDVIKLSKVEEISPRIVELSKTNLTPKSIKVTVIGEVNRPGQLELNSNVGLVQAVLAAGGPINWTANKGNVQLVRINENGSINLKKYKINLKNNLPSSKNPILKNGDMIKVNQTNYAKASNGLGVLFSPVTPLINAVSLFKLLED